MLAPRTEVNGSTEAILPPPSAGALLVDLDGTLVATDLLWECALELLRSRPVVSAHALLWLLRGPSYFARRLAEAVALDVETLPYRPEVLDDLAEQKAAGRILILATARHEPLARAVAAHLDLFDDVITTGGSVDPDAASRDGAAAPGERPSSDAPAGSPARRSSRWESVAARESGSRARPVAAATYRPPARSGPNVADWVRTLRPHQWAKNLLLLVPLLTAHRIFDLTLLLPISIAFVAFSLTASSVYITNDLLDLKSDRRHPTKRRRPFASGAVPIPVGIATAVGLLGLAATLAGLLPPGFTQLLGAYFVLTVAYSFCLKRQPMVDVICLAGLYTTRILAGCEATSITVSDWLLAFSLFFFLSLALIKRYVELSATQARDCVPGRGYTGQDLEIIRSLGPACGYLSVLIFCLYIHGSAVTELYRYPRRLWLLCPVLLYWIGRAWLKAGRREIDDDPVLFALRDPASYAVGLVTGAILLAAM